MPDTVFLCKKIKLCATIDTVNMYVYSSQRQTIKYKCEDRDRQNKNQIKKAMVSMIGKTTMIILYVTYASLESKKTHCTSNLLVYRMLK